MKSKLAYNIIRIISGLAWIAFGAMKFIPPKSPPPLPEAALNFMIALASTGYFIQFLALTEILVGVLLLFNRSALAMVILSPVMLNIILFSIFLSPAASGLFIIGPLVLMQIYIMYCVWPAYKPLFQKVKVSK